MNKNWFQRLGIVRGLSRRKFESDLSRLVNSALGHEAEGLPAGSDEYKRLWAMAEAHLMLYCKETDVDRADLEAQIPALRKLKSLAEGKDSKASQVSPLKIFGALVGIAMALWALGAATGLFQAGQHFMLNHLAR